MSDFNEITSAICERLKKVRIILNINQNDLANILGTTQTSISAYENFGKTGQVLTRVMIYFFTEHKLNPMWLFSKNNEDIQIFLADVSESNMFDYRDVLINRAIDKLSKVEKDLEEIKEDLKTK
jgi:transcriptional regulator with XRE-family HTH domain